MFDTPVLFIVFNRPHTTAIVFEEIKKIQPSQLYIAADGPRKEFPGDVKLCAEVLNYVLSKIDWACEVKTLVRDENLGCGVAVSEAIAWFFNNEEQGIILEDDIVPAKSFFLFCREMLFKFKDDHTIMHVSGSNFQLSQVGPECYYLSKLPHAWGWATWKRAWQKFDFALKDFNENHVQPYFNYPSIDKYWHYIFNTTRKELYHDIWDYQWVFALLNNNGFSILPQQNLVSNIGFGTNSTNTSDAGNFLSNLKRYEMEVKPVQGDQIYDPVADINFQKLFGWEIPIDSSGNGHQKESLTSFFAKVKQKFTRN